MADLIFHSFPLALLKRNHILATKVMEEKDRKILDGLRNAGFALDNGPDDSGLMMKYLQIGGGMNSSSQVRECPRLTVGQDITSMSAPLH
jgi:hypothetical protein